MVKKTAKQLKVTVVISSELAALEELSKMCGEEKSKEKDKTASTPLVTVSDLQRLPQWSMVVLRIRMMPFKTKLTPNWKMEKENAWGKKYGKAEYPVREKTPIHLFDLKKFVDDKMNEKMMNEFGPAADNMYGMPNMFGGMNPMMPNQFGNKNPFEINNNQNLFNLESNNPNKGMSLDMDSLLKKIDAKIAELEEEEKLEKNESANNTPNMDLIQNKNESVVKNNQNDDNITDDQFFDDFFSDED